MSRWVRLDCSFYSDARTHKLRARIKDAALWIVPRLWCFAADHAPDGNLSAYPADVLADELRYKGNSKVLIDALKDANFLSSDGILIGWGSVYGLPASREASTAKAREAKAAKRSLPPVPPSEKKNGTIEDESETRRNSVTDAVTEPVTEDRLPLPLLSFPSELPADEAEKLVKELQCPVEWLQSIYGPFRDRKVTFAKADGIGSIEDFLAAFRVEARQQSKRLGHKEREQFKPLPPPIDIDEEPKGNWRYNLNAEDPRLPEGCGQYAEAEWKIIPPPIREKLHRLVA